MINLSKALSFIKKLNESVQTFLATNSRTISDTKKECELADEQAKAFINEIYQKVKNYKDKNFGSIINSVNKLINSLTEEYPSECKSAKAHVAKYDFEKIEDGLNVLKEEVSVFNKLADQLESVDYDEKCPPKSIKVDGEVITVSSSCGTETFNTHDDKDDLTIPQVLDSELVEKTITHGLNVIAIIERISSIFERELDIPSLIKNNDNLLNNYKTELNSNCETFVNESFSKSIDSKESRDYYSKFFEELDSMDLASTPNIETGSEKFKEGIQMGRLKLNVCDTSDSKGKEVLKYLKDVDILKERIGSSYLDFPLVADLRDKGNVLLRINEENYSNATKDFVNQLIIAFSLSFPCSRVHFKLVDIGNKMGFSSLIAFRKVSNNIFLDGIVRDERELDDAIKSVKNLKLAAEDKLNLDAMSNVFDYNKKMDAAPMDVYLFVLVDFPSKIVGSHANDIKNIVCNGKDFGIFSVIVDNGAIELEYNFERSDYQKVVSDIAKTAYVFDLYGDEINYIEKHKHYKLTLLTEVGKNNLAKIIEVLSNNAHTETSKPIPLTKMFEYMDNTKVGSISSEFEIPFGMAGADVQTLRLGKEPHSAVIGGTGSGKSIFFHTLILDACYRYSPEELNFYLLDFKGGMEFSYYKDNKLPHVKLIGLTKDMNDGLSILVN